MGTTLEHGVYLPDEGERNCYAGLKVNWETLDQKVADISALQSAIAGALHREIVATLPTTDIDTATIYMILNGTSATENIYDEYMYISNAWELIGTSATDLTNYYTKGEVDSKLLLKASASDLTSHTGDTTIHVTASDKAKWNTVALIKQLRLVNTQVGSATSIAFANIDDTNGIKVGDKCMDLDAKMFEITAVDTTNQTVTVGTALIDLALDAKVVHTNKNDDVSIPLNSTSAELGVTGGSTNITFSDKNGKKLSSLTLGNYASSKLSYARLNIFDKDADNNEIQDTLEYAYVSNNTNAYLRVYRDNFCALGTASFKWKGVYATNYYYGANNIEFSTKFVTTDTNQTIAGTKDFTQTLRMYNTDTTATPPQLQLRNSKVSRGSTTEIGAQNLLFADKTGKIVSIIESRVASNGNTSFTLQAYNVNANNETITGGVQIIQTPSETIISPTTDNAVENGRSNYRWSNTNTILINGLTPSNLSLPNYAQRIDIAGYITDLTGGNNTYTPVANGYIYIRTDTGLMLEILDVTSGIGSSSIVQSSDKLRIFLPVVAQRNVYIKAKCTSLVSAVFVPCFGNI